MFNAYLQKQFGVKSDLKRHLYSNSFLHHFECLKDDELVIDGKELGETIPIMSTKFSPHNKNHICAVDEHGGIMIFDTKKSITNFVVEEWPGHDNAIFDVSWTNEYNKLLTASGDKSIILWDILTQVKLQNFKGHSSSVKTICAHPFRNYIYASGSRDGSIIIWDERLKQCGRVNKISHLAQTIQNAHKPSILADRRKSKRFGATTVAVTSVLYLNDYQLLSSGSSDGEIQLWDLRNSNKGKFDRLSKPVHTFPYPELKGRTNRGYSSMVLDSNYSRLYACCMDGVIYSFSCTNLLNRPIAAFAGHETQSHYVKISLSPDDLFLISGSSSKNAYIWDVNKPNNSPLILTGHEQEVTCVQWRYDNEMIVTCSDDDTMRFWKLKKGNEKSCNSIGNVNVFRNPIDLKISQNTERLPKGLLSPVKRAPKGLSFQPSSSRRVRLALSNLPSTSKIPDITNWLKCEKIMPYNSPKQIPIINLIKSPLKNNSKTTVSRALFRQPLELLAESPNKKRTADCNINTPSPKRRRNKSAKDECVTNSSIISSPRTPELQNALLTGLNVPSTVSPDVLGLLKSPTKDLPDFVKTPVHRTPHTIPVTPVNRSRKSSRKSTSKKETAETIIYKTTRRYSVAKSTMKSVEKKGGRKRLSLGNNSLSSGSIASKSILKYFSPTTEKLKSTDKLKDSGSN